MAFWAAAQEKERAGQWSGSGRKFQIRRLDRGGRLLCYFTKGCTCSSSVWMKSMPGMHGAYEGVFKARAYVHTLPLRKETQQQAVNKILLNRVRRQRCFLKRHANLVAVLQNLLGLQRCRSCVSKYHIGAYARIYLCIVVHVYSHLP